MDILAYTRDGFTMISDSESLLKPELRHILVLLISTCLMSACGIGAMPNSDKDLAIELGAATETPVEPAGESNLTPGENSLPEASENLEAITPPGASENTGGNSQPDTSEITGLASPPAEMENLGENELSGTENTNLAPTILDTSYGCDPVMESVLLAVGETDNFTLSVDDELPLSMQFNADSISPGTVSVSVDENGIFTVMALQKGESDVWLSVFDHEGLMDEYKLHIVVE